MEFFLNFVDRLEEGMNENEAIREKLDRQDVAQLDVFTSSEGPAKMQSSATPGWEDSLFGTPGGDLADFFDPQLKVTQPDHEQSQESKREQALLNYDLSTFSNTVWETFLGSQIQLTKVEDQDGTQRVTSKNITKQGPIQLRAENQNLYNAWEKSRESLIQEHEDLKVGQQMSTQTWTCRPPNLQFFQINRVQYDKHLQKPVKNNQKFHFDRTIYMDLFLYKNLDKSERYFQDLKQMSQENEALKKEYSAFMNDQMGYKSVAGLKRSLEMVADVRDDSSDLDIFLQPKEVNPFQMTIRDLGATPQEQTSAMSFLQKYVDKLEEKKNRLEQKIEASQAAFNQPYAQQQNRQHPYHLHAIMIHDGDAFQGHYWVYVYDRFHSWWWKIMDKEVSKVTDEAEMLKEAYGGDGYKSASTLVYASDAIVRNIDKYHQQMRLPLYCKRHLNSFDVPQKVLLKIQANRHQNEASRIMEEIQSYQKAKHEEWKQMASHLTEQAQFSDLASYLLSINETLLVNYVLQQRAFRKLT